MPVARTSISLSLELDQALGNLVASSGQPKSRVIETLLRENALVRREIESMRLEHKIDVIAVPGRRRKTTAPRPATAQRA